MSKIYIYLYYLYHNLHILNITRIKNEKFRNTQKLIDIDKNKKLKNYIHFLIFGVQKHIISR